MVSHRKISWHRYFIAAVIALLIFSLGLSLGMIIDNERFKWIITQNEKQEIDYRSLQFQYLYINSVLGDDNETCAVLQIQLEDTLSDLGYSLDKLLNFQKESNLNKEEYDLLHRRYIIDNLEYWLFAKKTKDLCNTDLVTVLYFFSGTECDICPDQGVILTYFKRKYEEKLLIFPIDVDLEEDEPIIKILKRRYKVYNYPTIIVEDSKFEGVVQKSDLAEIICDNFNDPASCQT